MALLNVAPTKSGLLALRAQLAFAEEGYDLLEQKRQILIFELMRRSVLAAEMERKTGEILSRAFAALREAELDVGSAALERAALGPDMDYQVSLSEQRLMGIRLPAAAARAEAPGVRFGLTGTSANADAAMLAFAEVLPLAAELAGLENTVLRLARELRKTQRRCNALYRTIMPNYRETIRFISGALEERERESFIILKMIRDRLAAARATDG